MGTALAMLCAHNGFVVTIWTIESDVVNTINAAHHNYKYLPKIKLPESVRATGDLTSVLKEHKLIISALPTQVTSAVFKDCARYITDEHSILSVSKGFIQATGETVCTCIKHIVSNAHVAALMGPLFANEIAEGKLCAALLAGAHEQTRAAFKQVLQNEMFRVQESDDIVGAEASGALKNIYAIFMGILAGLCYGWNTKSAFMTMALQEMALIVEHLGGKRDTVYGVAGLGDLVTTGFGEQSRNRRFGQALCTEKSVKKAVQSVGQVIEGVKTLEAIDQVISNYGKALPFLELIQKLVKEEGNRRGHLEYFFKQYMV